MPAASCNESHPTITPPRADPEWRTGLGAGSTRARRSDTFYYYYFVGPSRCSWRAERGNIPDNRMAVIGLLTGGLTFVPASH